MMLFPSKRSFSSEGSLAAFSPIQDYFFFLFMYLLERKKTPNPTLILWNAESEL